MGTESFNVENAEPAEILRMRLVQIDDELRGLPADAFAAKHELNLEADEVRKALAEVEGDQSEALDEWNKRSARKSTHEIDPEVAKAVVQTKGSVGDGGR